MNLHVQATTSRRTLYQSDQITVIFDPVDSKGVVVTLANFVEPGEVPASFGDGFVQSLGLAAVFVVARTNSWWQLEEMPRVCEMLKSAIAGYQNRIAYGSSMGGYGALSLAQAMGCIRILAIAPQAVISDLTIPFNPDWRAAISKRPILRDSVPEDLDGLTPEILFDPYSEQDSVHVDHLKRAGVRVIEYPLIHAGHKILVTLKECGMLRWAIGALLQDELDFTEVLARYEATCEASPRYLGNLGDHLVRMGDFVGAERQLGVLRAIGADAAVKKLQKGISRAREAASRNTQ